MDLMKFMMELDIYYYLVLDGMLQFLIGLNVLWLKKSSITDSTNHNSARIRIDSYNFLPIENTLTFHNVIILINSVTNKNKNNHY